MRSPRSGRKHLNKSVVELETIHCQEFDEFVARRDCQMMLLLSRDVTADDLNIQLADREGPVTPLPAKLR